jgi:hypothetical protein
MWEWSNDNHATGTGVVFGKQAKRNPPIVYYFDQRNVQLGIGEGRGQLLALYGRHTYLDGVLVRCLAQMLVRPTPAPRVCEELLWLD